MGGGASAERIIWNPAGADEAIAGITPWSNPFSSLKKERIKKRIYTTREIAKTEISDYIDIFHTRTRRHAI